ncbi:MAG: LamG-like jellyroll fold domain-containing protein [Candidatus Shapirobacteria bacterium]
MTRLSYKTLFTIVVILLIGIVALLRIQQKPTTILAEWFNDAWMYRQQINISTHSVDETNVYISTSINIGTTAKSQPDNGDFRFTTASGQLLDYYIVSGTGTTNVSFHINFDSFPAGAQTIYAYYGNSSADNEFSNSDFSNVASSYSIGSPVTEEIGGGPVLWYKFDEGVGTSINNSGSDRSLIGYLSSNTTWTSDSDCLSGKCVSMPGTSIPNVTVYDNSLLDFDTGNFTVQMWGNYRDFTYPKTWFMAYKSGTCYSAGHPGWDIGHGYNANGINICYSDGTNLVTNASITFDNGYKPTDLKNKWAMLSVVFDKTNNRVKFYVNGVKQSNEYDISSVTGSVNNSSSLIFGTMYGWNTDAKIDETKVFSYARTANQIKQDYTTGISGQSSSDSGVNFGSNSTKGISDGLIAYYKFDEGVGSSLADSSGNNRTATLGNGDSSPTWSNGKFGIGASFDNTNDYIGVTLPNITTTVGGYNTVSFWMYWNGTVGKIPVNLRGGSSNYYELWFPISTCMGFNTGASDAYGINPTGLANKWVHVTLVMYNGLYTGKSKIYINGISQEMSQCYGTERTGGAGTSLNLGTMYPGQSYYFGGSLDEVRVYNRGLSATDVKNLYNYSPSPIAYWNFDEGSGTTGKDSSGNNRTATLQNGAGFAPGKYGHALSLNVDATAQQYASISTINHNYSFTKEAWIYPTTTTGCGNENRCSVIGPYFEVLSNLQYYDYSMVANQGWHSGGSIPLNSWTHVAVSYDMSNVKLFVNGIQVLNNAVGSTNIHSSNYIGAVSPSSRNFRGQIDEVKIYDYARTAEQVLQDMAGDSQSTPHNGKPIIWYKFDEGASTLVNNSGVSSSTYHADFGTGSSAPTWANGKNGKGLTFNGTSTYAALNSLFTPNEQNFTLSSWFNFPSGSTNPEIPIFGSNQYTSTLGYVPSSKRFQHYKQYTGGVGSTTMSWTTSYQYADSNWHYVAVSVDQGTTAATLYLDGKKFGSISIGGTEGYTHSNGSFRYIGRNYGYYSVGSIDEMKVYNYALTEDEIKSDYNQAASFVFGSSNQTIGNTITSLDYCVPGDTSSCIPPIYEWNFNEGTGTTAFDSGTGIKPLPLLAGTSAPQWQVGKYGKGLYFDGNDGVGYNDGGNIASTTGPVTINAWVKTKSTSSGGIVCRYGNSGTWTNCVYMSANGKLNFLRSSLDGWSTTLTSNISINDDKWHFISARFDYSTMKIYIDGKEDNSVNETRGSNYSLWSFCIGNQHYLCDGTAYNGHFTGLIDEVHIFNYARTPAQIAYDYNKGGPVGWWKLDECQGSVANDNSGISNSGSISIGGTGPITSAGTCSTANTAWGVGSTGKVNSSIHFDGNSDYIEIPDNPSLNLTGSFSLSTWVKPQALPQYTCLLERGTAITSRYYIWLGYEDVLFGVNNDFSSYDANLTIGQWAHITVVHNSETDTDYVYKDGSLIRSATSRTTDPATTGVLRIGQPTNATYQNNYFTNGQLDDVRVYNYPLTSTQVKAIYNGGSINFK